MSRQTTTFRRFVIDCVCILSPLILTGQSFATNQLSSSERPSQGFFLQGFVKDALEQKESLPEGGKVPSEDTAIASRREKVSQTLGLSPAGHGQTAYNRATLTMVLWLGVILFVLGASGYIIRCYFFEARRFGKRDPALRILGRLNLTPKASVALLEAPGKLLLIGISGGTLTVLSEMPVSERNEGIPAKDMPLPTFEATLAQETQHANSEFSAGDPFLHVTEHIKRKVSGLKQL